MTDAQQERAKSNPDEELIEFFMSDDAEEGGTTKPGGPHILADMGPPHYVQPIECRPNFPHQGDEEPVSYNALITLLRKHKLVPVRWEKGWKFIQWSEARLWFDTLFDKYMVGHWNIFPTDKKEKKSVRKNTRATTKTQKTRRRKVDTKPVSKGKQKKIPRPKNVTVAGHAPRQYD